MSQTQSCYVCGATGLLVEGRVFAAKDTTGGPVFIGECPRCRRFICNRHGEKLDLSPPQKRSFFGLGGRKEPGRFTVCCPFDPGVALGDPD